MDIERFDPQLLDREAPDSDHDALVEEFSILLDALARLAREQDSEGTFSSIGDSVEG